MGNEIFVHELTHRRRQPKERNIKDKSLSCMLQVHAYHYEAEQYGHEKGKKNGQEQEQIEAEQRRRQRYIQHNAHQRKEAASSDSKTWNCSVTGTLDCVGNGCRLRASVIQRLRKRRAEGSLNRQERR